MDRYVLAIRYGLSYYLQMSIDWSGKVRDLQGAGLTLAEIGTRIGLAISSVGDIATARSSSPHGEAAVRLYHLHERLCLPLRADQEYLRGLGRSAKRRRKRAVR